MKNQLLIAFALRKKVLALFLLDGALSQDFDMSHGR